MELQMLFLIALIHFMLKMCRAAFLATTLFSSLVHLFQCTELK